MSKKHDRRIGIVYSTDPDFEYETDQDQTPATTLAPKQQKLRVLLDRKQRGGKTVTLVQGFVGTDEDLKSLEKLLKNKCGVGGSSKDGEIIIQGDRKTQIAALLQEMGYKTVMSGGKPLLHSHDFYCMTSTLKICPFYASAFYLV